MDYYVEIDPSEDTTHLVHTAKCRVVDKEELTVCVGDHSGASFAIAAARKYFLKLSFCPSCLRGP